MAFLLIYGCYTATYWSKLNTPSAPYQYYDYVGSQGTNQLSRSLDDDTVDVAEDDNDIYSSVVTHPNWWHGLQHSLTFIFDAIEKMPK